MTVGSIGNVVESAVYSAGSSNTIPTTDINKILATLDNEIGKDMVTLAELRAVDSTLNRLASSGKISWEKAETFRGQIRDSVDRAISNQHMKASDMAKQWLEFNGPVGSGQSELRTMANQAATNKHSRFSFGGRWGEGGGGFFGFHTRRQHAMKDGEVTKMLDKAAEDGRITLGEINAMYAGVNDAFKAGDISRTERNKMINELETSLKRKAGKRRGACSRRIKGPYHDKLTENAKNFIEQGLGGTVSRSKGKGWTTYKFDKDKVQNYTKAICQDGAVTPTERHALMNMLLRDGRVTLNEMQTVRQAFAWARWQGHISTQEYNRTVRIFEVEIAKMAGGVTADVLQEEISVNRMGFHMIQG